MDSIAKLTLGSVKKVIAANAGNDVVTEQKEVDRDVKVFGDINRNIIDVLEKCNRMRYLCQKSAKTGYLSHF